MTLIRKIYDIFSMPIQHKWVGSFQAGAVVRNLYLNKYLLPLIKNNNSTILDAGCGKDAAIVRIYAHKFPLCQFTAIDLNLPDEFNLNKLENVNFIPGELTDIKLKDYNYDIIYCLDVLEHIEDYEKCLISFSKGLKENGTLLLHVPYLKQKTFLNPPCPHNSINSLQQGEKHVREGFSLEHLKNALEKVGLKITEHRFTFGSLVSFFKEIYMWGEHWHIPAIGLIIFPFLLISTLLEASMDLKSGNGLFIAIKKV